MGSVIYGLVACVIASFCTGTGFVPIKRYPQTDGFFNQLLTCIGAFCVAFVVNCIQGFPDVYPLVMIGGAFWAISSAFGIVIINVLGLGVSVLLWNAAACIIGWSQSKFGWPNLPKQDIKGVWLNYIGLVILICGASCYVFVRSDSKSIVQDEEDDEQKSERSDSPIPEKYDDTESALTKTAAGPSLAMKTLGVLGAIVCGLGYGTMITPISYIQTHKSDFMRHGTLKPTDESLDYVFSFFIGTLLASIAVFLIYSVVKKNRPVINNQVMLPSFLSGIIFGISQTFFIVANQELSQTIAYPVCTMLPGFVASMWSVVYFREISGRRNFLILGSAYTLTLIGVVCVTISKDSGF